MAPPSIPMIPSPGHQGRAGHRGIDTTRSRHARSDRARRKVQAIRQSREAMIGCHILNQMAEFGRPKPYTPDPPSTAFDNN